MSDERGITLQRLAHMVEAADAIAAYVARGREVFDADQAVRDAILFRIVVIGEAAKAVVQRDPALAADLSEVEVGRSTTLENVRPAGDRALFRQPPRPRSRRCPREGSAVRPHAGHRGGA